MSRIPYIVRDERDRQRIAGLVAALGLDKPWSVTIEPYKKKRSLSQNNLYWKWIGIVAEETGNDNDDLHEFFKGKFLIPRPIQIGGDTADIRTTTKLDTLEMKAYMDKVYAFVTSQLGILLPVPEDQIERAA